MALGEKMTKDLDFTSEIQNRLNTFTALANPTKHILDNSNPLKETLLKVNTEVIALPCYVVTYSLYSVNSAKVCLFLVLTISALPFILGCA